MMTMNVKTYLFISCKVYFVRISHFQCWKLDWMTFAFSSLPSYLEHVFVAKLSSSWQVQFELELSLALILFISAPPPTHPRGSSELAVNEPNFGMVWYGMVWFGLVWFG